MNTNGELQQREASVLEVYAHEHGLSGRKMYETLAATIFPSKQSATPEQVNSLLIVARAYDLNPFTRELYAFPSKGGGIVPIVSVDGWAKLASSHPMCEGIEVSVAMADDGRTPVSATARVHRRDWKVPFELTEYYHEVRRNTEPWRNQPVRMIRHRAMTQAIRMALGFGNLHEADEAARRDDAIVPAEYREAQAIDPLTARIKETTPQAQPAGGEAEKQGFEGDAPAARSGGGTSLWDDEEEARDDVG